MSRSKWKGNYVKACVAKSKNLKKKIVWSRSSTILPAFVGQTVLVHNGKMFKKIFINSEKVGYKFGQFIFTRKPIKKKLQKTNVKKKAVKKIK